MSDKKQVTIFDVAEAAGVSYSTVSRVVNAHTHISPSTRTKVQGAMEELGYVVDQRARSLAGGKTNVIGVLAAGIDASFMGELLRGIDARVSETDMDMLLCTTHSRKGKEAAYATKLSNGMVDGLILTVPLELSRYLPTLQARSVPHVLVDIDKESRSTPLVKVSNRAGAREMVEHLISLGHRRIGFITGRTVLQSARERVEGFNGALDAAGIEFDPKLVIEGDFLRVSGYEGGHKLLELDEPPTAIFASSDEMAFGVLRAAGEKGLSVPEQLSVTGFDDVAETQWMNPGLTTVHQPIQEIGERAVDMLLSQIQDPGRTPAVLELPTRLIIRGTCGPPHSQAS